LADQAGVSDLVDSHLVNEAELDPPLDVHSMIEGAFYDGGGTGHAVASILKSETREQRQKHKKGGTLHLDTAAGESIVNDMRLFMDDTLTDAGPCMTIDGINASSDGLTTCTMGTTIVGPRAYYHPRASANVLSFGDVVDEAADKGVAMAQVEATATDSAQMAKAPSATAAKATAVAVARRHETILTRP
jgi:hypothetical protein